MAGSSGKFDRDQLRAWSTGLDIPAAAFAMGFLGWLIDRWQGTSPWWMLGLGIAGIGGGFYRFMREAMRMNREQTARFNRDHRIRDRGGRKSPPPETGTPSPNPDANNDVSDSPRA